MSFSGRNISAIILALLIHTIGYSQCKDLCGYIMKYENEGKMESFSDGMINMRFLKTSGMKVGHTGLLYQELGSKGWELSKFYPKKPKDDFESLMINESWTVLADVRVEAINDNLVTYSIIRRRYRNSESPERINEFEEGFTMIFRAINYTDGKLLKLDLPDSIGGWREGCACDGTPWGPWRYYDRDGKLYKEALTYFDSHEGPITLFSENGDTISQGGYQAGERSGIWREFHSNGKLKSVIEYFNGKPIGIQRLYHYNGQLKLEGELDYHGDKEGLWLTYHPNGQIASKILYNNNECYGVYEEYYENGNPKTVGKCNNFNDRQSGWTEYHENGQESKMLNYKMGRLIGGKEWHSNGNQRAEYKIDYFDGDTTKYAEFYENGNLKLLEAFSRDKRDGPYEEYYDNGQVKIKRIYSSGKRAGDWMEYYEDGTLKLLEENGWDTLHGKYEEYYPNGQAKVRARYTEGYLSGTYLEYFEDRQVKISGYYYTRPDIMKLSGKKNGGAWKDFWGRRYGKWIEYYSNGKMKSSGKYEKGKKVGKWIYWDEAGNKRVEKN